MPNRFLASVVWFGFVAQGAGAQDKLYTTNGWHGEFVRSNLDGSDYEEFFTYSADPEVPQIVTAVQINPLNDQLYWNVNNVNTGIWTLRTGEATPVQLTSRIGRFGFVLDPVVERLYASGLYSLSLDGTILQHLATASTGKISGAPGHEWVYWVLRNQRSIRRVRTDGSEIETVIELPEQILEGIAVDSLNDMLYWYDTREAIIRRLDINTGEVKVVARPGGFVLTMAIDVARQHLYGTLASGGVFRLDLATGEVVQLLPFLSSSIGLALLLECGNLAIDAGETCDIYIPTGQLGSCPTVCPEFDQDPCTRNTLIDKNTCTARCELMQITEPRNFDGCCPPDGIEGRDTDCGVPVSVPTISGSGQVVLVVFLLVMIAVRFRKSGFITPSI